MENLPGVIESIPEHSPLCTSISKQLFEGHFLFFFVDFLGVSPSYISDFLGVSPQAARKYNQKEVEPFGYFVSELVGVKIFKIFKKFRVFHDKK